MNLNSIDGSLNSYSLKVLPGNAPLLPPDWHNQIVRSTWISINLKGKIRRRETFWRELLSEKRDLRERGRAQVAR